MNKQILKLSKASGTLTTEILDLSKRESEVLSMYLKIRDLFFKLSYFEEQNDENTPGIRYELNTLYNDFYQIFGRLNKTRNKNILSIDPYSFLILASIEVKIDSEYRAADILFKSTKGEIDVFKTENVIEAMSYCLGLYGEINLEFISQITDKEIDEVILELDNRIYYSPIENKFITQEQWLSGNVYSKMCRTEEILNNLLQENQEA